MKLRVLTYNIHRAIGIDRLFRLERIAKILAHHDADIILLQEVDVGVPRSGKLDLARELAWQLRYRHYALGLNVHLRTGMYGNATLSRFPILKQRNIDLTIGPRKARGCLYTLLSVPFKSGLSLDLAVFNLHLGISFKERPPQIGRLVHTPEFRLLDAKDPCIVAGDFNDWQKRLAPMLTEILDFDCATNHQWGYQNAFLTYPAFSPTGGLDKIFCRGGIRIEGGRRCRLRSSRMASDHLPVIADLII
jgi:endonuclease/exonuclease/phosphatase family metal-dependent hydrolase